MDIATALADLVEAQTTITKIIESSDFKESAALYGQFMCSDEVKALLPPVDLSDVANLYRTDWELGLYCTSDRIHLTNWYYQEDQSVSIPVRWFSDNEAFRAETVEKAAAATQAAADKAERKKVDAREERRAQYLALAREFAPDEDDATVAARRKQYESLDAEFGEATGS